MNTTPPLAALALKPDEVLILRLELLAEQAVDELVADLNATVGPGRWLVVVGEESVISSRRAGLEGAMLGLASTRELLEELIARLDPHGELYLEHADQQRVTTLTEREAEARRPLVRAAHTALANAARFLGRPSGIDLDYRTAGE